MPNITTPSIGVMAEVLIQLNEAGRKSATAVTSTTMRVMCAAIQAESWMRLFFIASEVYVVF